MSLALEWCFEDVESHKIEDGTSNIQKRQMSKCLDQHAHDKYESVKSIGFEVAYYLICSEDPETIKMYRKVAIKVDSHCSRSEVTVQRSKLYTTVKNEGT